MANTRKPKFDLSGMTKRFIESISDVIERDIKVRVQRELARLTSNLSALGDGGGTRKAKSRRGGRAGRKLDMACRYPGCKNRSKGPRFHFLCEDHLKLGKSAIARAKGKGGGKSASSSAS